MLVKCLDCKKKFVPEESNTGIHDPYIKVTCPFCFHVYEDKFLNFVVKQNNGFTPHSISDASRMIKMAQFVELNSSDYYKKRGLRHGGKKKIRDLRD